MSLGRRHYAARVGIFLIAAALLVGMVGCGGMPETGPYKLTIASTLRGSVTTPGEGTFTYDEGTMVNLAAEAEEGYRFLEWTGDVDTIADVNAATTTITINGKYDITAHFGWPNIIITQVAAGGHHTVGLREDGTVVAVGDNSEGQCDIDGWTDIKKIAAGAKHTAGLKSNGTVVAVGANASGQCNVGNFTNIIQVAAGSLYTVVLKTDGTVVAVGSNASGQCDVGDWRKIIQVAAGGYHTVGLKSDGTVIAVGADDYSQCNVGNWTDIVQVAPGGLHTLGLKSKGAVAAVGWNYYQQCNVDSWDLD
jgi:alpha-tubulin suppressor-like RCC1 family protein